MGKYAVKVTLLGKNVGGATYALITEPGELDFSKSKITGNGIQEGTNGQLAQFNIATYRVENKEYFMD